MLRMGMGMRLRGRVSVVVVVHEGILALARARAVVVPSIIRIRRGGRTVTMVGVRLFRRGRLGDIALM